MGYHIDRIPRGVYGEISKVHEEVHEALDADKQGNPLMALQELSDVIGAIEGYLDKYFDDKITLGDLITMSRATHRAFQSGRRS